MGCTDSAYAYEHGRYGRHGGGFVGGVAGHRGFIGGVGRHGGGFGGTTTIVETDGFGDVEVIRENAFGDVSVQEFGGGFGGGGMMMDDGW